MVSGPSGVGKGAVVERLLRLLPDLRLSVSATTRSARPGEVEGVHYHFVAPATFQALIDTGGFLEWASMYGHRSGTPREPLERELTAGHDVVLEINVDGARQVRARTEDAFLVFIKPPSLDELERRLRRRGTETEAQVRRRLGNAAAEMGAEGEFDLTVVNDDLDRAAAEVAQAIQRLRQPSTTPP